MKARVLLHGVPCGILALTGDLTTFRFLRSYLDLPERPVLGRWFEDKLGPDVIAKRSRSEVPTFFQNVLPEPSSALRTLLARRANVPENRELALLAALGEDLPGAMTVELLAEEADEESAAPSEPLPAASTDAARLPEGPLRFSLAGMQLKLSVLLKDEKLTLSATGAGGRYILKMPPTTLSRVPRNEHVVMTWARASGIDAAKTELVRVADVAGLPAGLPLLEDEALLVERFDRPLGQAKVHQEDFAQVLGVAPGEKYGREARVSFDGLGKVIAAVAGRDDFEAFVTRLVFCVLCNNPDAHLKNWSFWYPDRRKPRLSPAYDQVSASLYPAVDRRLACRLGGEWEMSRLRTHHFGTLASHAGFAPEHGVALAEAAASRIREAWQRLPQSIDVPADLARAVTAHLASVSLP